MKLEQFAMERMQSTYENLVEFNLSESGVRPLTPRELIDDAAGLDGLLDQPLVYSQSNGTIELRQAIASMYPGAGIDHIEVTNGGSEANFITTFNLIEPGDEVVMLVPNYMQTWGLSRAFGGTIREWRLIEDHDAGRWRVDLDALEVLRHAAHEDDRHLQSEQPDRRAPDRGRSRCDCAHRRPARRVDPLRRGLSRRRDRRRRNRVDVGPIAERAIITSGLSKAYGLPGLRIGWIVGPPLARSPRSGRTTTT